MGSVTLERGRFNRLIEALRSRGYEVLGPTVHQGAIAFAPVSSAADLPEGLTDEQEGGTYRLRERDDAMLFGFANGPQSWKRILHPPAIRLWRARRDGDAGIELVEEPDEAPKRAFLGVRSCDIHAIAMLDDALLNIEHPDPAYRRRREAIFVVALNCATAGGTCFCVSMNTGPRATFGFDIALTEIIEAGRHYFVAESGSERGAEVIAELPTADAVAAERERADEVVARTAASMGRRMPADDPREIKDLLYRNLEHPRWEEVADRCLSCGNCTSVCPTCFCTDVDDVTDLTVRLVEMLYAADEAFRLIADYEPPDPPSAAFEPRAAIGCGWTEAPRGTLWHRYRIEADGTIADARIVPPTSQNQATIEADLRDLVAEQLELPDAELS